MPLQTAGRRHAPAKSDRVTVHANGHETSLKACSTDMRKDPGWLLAPTHYLTICLAPNVLAMLFSPQILTWEHWQIATLMLGIDLFFTAGSFLFMQRIARLDSDWHGGTKPYPGPWRDLGREKLCAPWKFFTYVQVFFWTGLVLPVSALGASLLTPYSAIAACVIPPYIVTLCTQLVQEARLKKNGSATWVAVPLHHQVYRFLQMARGFYLVSVLQGPQWLTGLLLYILALWTFNYGSLMSWLTSMYFWHLQPEEGPKSE